MKTIIAILAIVLMCSSAFAYYYGYNRTNTRYRKPSYRTRNGYYINGTNVEETANGFIHIY